MVIGLIANSIKVYNHARRLVNNDGAKVQVDLYSLHDNNRGLDDAMLQAGIHVTMVTSASRLCQTLFSAVLLVKLMNFCYLSMFCLSLLLQILFKFQIMYT